jgi:hypothetical protein
MAKKAKKTAQKRATKTAKKKAAKTAANATKAAKKTSPFPIPFVHELSLFIIFCFYVSLFLVVLL